MMNKKGFTLIELMVVVVIIGILAAVAVPKLFGMIAKSKASEVGPAAGTYVKMQQAYVSEAMAIGNWAIIGYKAPGQGDQTTNFAYKDNGNYSEKNTAAIAGPVVGFAAANKAKLNDCALSTTADPNWSVSVAETSSGSGEVAFTSTTKCTDLTPTFETIGR